jgi:Uma2 family endonuclease
MGMPLPSHTYWTRDLVLALPDDGNRYELAYGELLVSPSPAPRHQSIHSRLFRALTLYLLREPVGCVWSSPADLSWGDETLLQPDLFVIPPDAEQARDWSELRDILLVVEILSPSTARNDRFPKRRRYQEAGVPLCWLLDPVERLAEVWTPTDSLPRIARDQLRWHPSGASAPCLIDLAAVFQD